ncbi:transposase [Shinella yambaruensis]|uniref:transposase n=2 Tax=Shinella yambaruensis TaxID=415996 RepID=UPI003D67E6D3
MIAILGERIASIQAAIDHHMKSQALTEHAHRITSAPGVGKVTALTLLAHMPELGSLSPKTAASLAGLAPFNDDSGRRSGRRRIKDGRPRVRKALYMAASARSRPQRACAPFIRPSQPEQAPQRPASSPSQESSSRSSMQCSATKLTSLEHSCHVTRHTLDWTGGSSGQAEDDAGGNGVQASDKRKRRGFAPPFSLKSLAKTTRVRR